MTAELVFGDALGSAIVPSADLPSTRADVSGRSPLQAITFFSLLIALASQGVFLLAPDSADLLNTWAPISLAACCLGGIAYLIRTSALWLWSPLVRALPAIAVFHGLGPLLLVFGT